MSESTSNLPAAGWYPDPENAGQDRWWNGVGWSDQRRPTAPNTNAPSAALTAPTVSPRPNPYATASVASAAGSTGSGPTSPYGTAAPGSTPYSMQTGAPASTTPNPLALAGLIVSCVSILLGFLLPVFAGLGSIVGAVLSGVGLTRAKALAAQGVTSTGRGLAIAGLVVGIVGFGFGLLLVVLFMIFLFAMPSFS